MDIEKFKDPEFQEKLRNAKSSDDILVHIREKGVELNDEQLEIISGGSWNGSSDSAPSCPYCGSSNVHMVDSNRTAAAGHEQGALWQCDSCGETWNQ